MNKDEQTHAVATLAGGCFWCTTSAFHGIEGVLKIESGYTGGHTENPTYEDVCSGSTGHYEAVRITYDPNLISYARLLDIFFRQIDPTDPDGSFVDRGSQYRSAVFYHSGEQKRTARSIIDRIQGSGLFSRPVSTKLIEKKTFYPAESYHQDYHRKNPVRYKYYRAASGRDIYIEQNRQNYTRLFNMKAELENTG